LLPSSSPRSAAHQQTLGPSVKVRAPVRNATPSRRRRNSLRGRRPHGTPKERELGQLCVAFAQPGIIGTTIRGMVGVRHSISTACGMPEGTVLVPLPTTTTSRAVSTPRHFGSCLIARAVSTRCQTAPLVLFSVRGGCRDLPPLSRLFIFSLANLRLPQPTRSTLAVRKRPASRWTTHTE